MDFKLATDKTIHVCNHRQSLWETRGFARYHSTRKELAMIMIEQDGLKVPQFDCPAKVRTCGEPIADKEYPRCDIVEADRHQIIVEAIRIMFDKHGNGTPRIVRDVIPRRHVESIQYFVN